jgi:hypothetical protein
LGVVLTSVDRRTNLWREVVDVVNQTVPGRGFETVISQAIEVAKAAGTGRTLFQTKQGAKHEVANQYRGLAQEIVWRTTNRDAFIAGHVQAPKLPVTRDELELEDDALMPSAAVNV